MTQSVDEQLRFAIAHKRLLQLHYQRNLRVVEPHDYGVQNGKPRLLAYQQRASGGAPGRSRTGWRLLEVSKIERCVVLDHTFKGSRGDPRQHHYTWDVLYARVE